MSNLVEELTPARLKFVVEHARPAESVCLCGCGETTRGRFVPGHDGRLRAQLNTLVSDGSREDKAAARKALRQFGWRV